MKRIARSGAEKFLRDRSSTGAALVAMTAALLVVGFLFVLQGMSEFLVQKAQEGVDVSAYFKESATQEEMSAARDRLLELDYVRRVEFVSREEALRRFQEAYAQNESVLAPLAAVGRNPLLAHVNIVASEPGQYGAIASFLEQEEFSALLADVDFLSREPVIERISSLSSGVRTAVLAVVAALSGIAALVAFNTIRLALYNSREEIEVQRLVGASNWFIRGPYLAHGALVGAASSIGAMALLVLAGFLANGPILAFTGFGVFPFLVSEFFSLLGIQLAFGVGLGVLSSAIAIRKYLKV